MVNGLGFIFISLIISSVGDRNGNENVTEKGITHNEGENESTVANDAENTSDDETCNITMVISKPYGKIQSANYPQPYPTNCQWTYIIHVGDGHSVKMEILTLDLDDEDKLLITPKANSDHVTNIETEQATKSTDNFQIDGQCCESVIIQFTVGKHFNNHTGFIITFQRNEQSDSEKDTEQLSGAYSWNQIYLCSLTVLQFKSIKETFRKSLISIAREYYKTVKQSSENWNVSQINVIINSIMQCPVSWPWSSNCVQVNFSVKLSNDPSLFSRQHAVNLWKLYRSTNELSKLGIWEYEIPNIEWLFWFWIVLIFLLSLLFCLLLAIITKTQLIHHYFRRLKIPNFTDESNITRWRHQTPFVCPVFNAENSHRFKFLKESVGSKISTTIVIINVQIYLEELTRQNERTSGPSINKHKYQFTNEVCAQSNGQVLEPQELVDDFDSDEDQHIYNTLTYK